MSETDPFGRLIDVDPRTAWTHEALAFTPWLAENLDRLSEAIGIPLEFTGREVGVGRYSADILAHNPVDDQIVLVENQLTSSDHGHLGQILTYLAGTDAHIVIWLAPGFSEEHLSAIRWLNQNSQEQFSFFAVRLRVVQIADSPLAPLFDVLEKPNSWERRLQQKAKASVGGATGINWRRTFWDHYLEKYPSASEDRGGGGYGSSRWRNVSNTGLIVARWVADDNIGVFIRGERGVPGAEVRERLGPKIEQLESQLGSPIGSDPNYLFLKRAQFDGADQSQWDQAVDWLESETKRFSEALAQLEGNSV